MPNKQSLAQAVAVALKLRKEQVDTICRHGGVQLRNKTQGIRDVKAVVLTIPQAGRIWGFLVNGRGLYPHINSGKLESTNDGIKNTRVRKIRVTVAAMLAMEEELEKSARGKTRG